jgi:hypothetical protein
VGRDLSGGRDFEGTCLRAAEVLNRCTLLEYGASARVDLDGFGSAPPSRRVLVIPMSRAALKIRTLDPVPRLVPALPLSTLGPEGLDIYS